jgi:trans-o-hydroxybenzylidenepyruvate hydratase-aldolase
MYFKSVFPTEFWEGVARHAPTTIMCKVSYPIDHLAEDLRVASHHINFVIGQGNLYEAYQKVGTQVTACWTTSAGMGPEPVVALMDAILRDDRARAAEIHADFEALGPMLPPGNEFYKEFPKYNAQFAKVRSNAAGWAKFGPFRAPYRDLPDGWEEYLTRGALAWRELRKKYAGVATT